MTDNAAFAAFVDKEISPLLAAMRLRNQQSRRMVKIGAALGGLAGFVAVAVLNHFSPLAPFSFVLLVGVAILLGAAPGWVKISKSKDEFADQHIARIAAFLGLDYQGKNFTPPYFQAFLETGLAPKSDRQTFTRLLAGTRNKVPFSFYEAHLQEWRTRTTGKTTRRELVTVFRGQFLHSAYPRKFAGKTVIVRDAGWFNKLGALGKGKGLKRVGLADPEFEKIFEVYSTDQVESRYLIDPLFMERLKRMEGQHKKRTITAAFSQGSMLVSLKGAGQYLPSLSRKEATALALADETKTGIERIFALLDSLVTRA